MTLDPTGPSTPAAAAEALRLSDAQARFEGLLKAAVEGIIVIDHRGAIEAFSAGAERMFEYRATEVIGRNVAVLMPEPDSGRHDDYIGAYLRTRTPKIIGIGREVLGLRKNGTRFPMELSVGEIASPSGIKFVGIVRDITRRKEIESALREREQELRLMVEHAPVGIFTADTRGYLLSVNPALADLLKRPGESLLGLPLTVLVEADSQARLSEAVRDALTEGKQVNLTNLHVRSGSGIVHVVSVYLAVIAHSGDAQQLIGQIIDRTGEEAAQEVARKLQDELAHVSRLTTLGEMASAISHEINQPLTVIATQAQAYRRLLQAGQATEEEISQGLTNIAEHALRIGEIVKRVRAFVTKRESARELVNVNEAVSQVLEFAQLDARKEGVRLEVSLAPELPKTLADSLQLQQVVLNLLRNAIDATKALAETRRVVFVETRRRDGELLIRVRDQGPGVAQIDQAKLFLPFFTTKPDGMGMGLSISHSIVQALGGALRYHDGDPSGAVFEVTLPVIV